MNKRLRIRVIDSRDRGKDLLRMIAEYNKWDEDLAIKYRIAPGFAENLSVDKPDLILCHINDLVGENGQPVTTYIEECAKEDITIVLYSAGIKSHEFKEEILLVTTNEGQWEFTLRNPGAVLVFPRNVFEASQLPIKEALEQVDEERDHVKRRSELFRILLAFDPLLEASLDLLYSLLEEPTVEKARDWQPPALPGLTAYEIASLRKEAEEMLSAPKGSLAKLRDQLLAKHYGWTA